MSPVATSAQVKRRDPVGSLDGLPGEIPDVLPGLLRGLLLRLPLELRPEPLPDLPRGLLLRLLRGLVLGLLAAGACRADEAVLSAQVDEPLAYGWRLGDRVRRVVHIAVPPGWQIDERSLPRPDQRGGEVELRSWSLAPEPEPVTGAELRRQWTSGPGGIAGQVDTAEPGEVGAAATIDGAVTATPATGWDDVLRQARRTVQPLWRGLSQRWTPEPPKGDGRDGALAVAARLRGAAAQQLVLDYQLFATAPAPRVLELPTLTLVYEPPPGTAGAAGIAAAASAETAGIAGAAGSVETTGTSGTAGAGPRELRLPARPLWLVPLAAGAPGHQDGLGEMRPDVGVPGLATDAAVTRLLVSLLLAVALLGLAATARLALRLAGVTGQAQPFRQAWRELRRLLPGRRGRGAAVSIEHHRAALRLLHQAFDRTAGRTLLPRQARAWARSDARFAAQADAVERFFQRSADQFFGAASGSRGAEVVSAAVTGGGPVAAGAGEAIEQIELAELVELARALARAEAGHAGPAGQASQAVHTRQAGQAGQSGQAGQPGQGGRTGGSGQAGGRHV